VDKVTVPGTGRIYNYKQAESTKDGTFIGHDTYTYPAGTDDTGNEKGMAVIVFTQDRKGSQQRTYPQYLGTLATVADGER